MNLDLYLEYYPTLKEEILKDFVQKIEENKTKWDKPFFSDTKSYLDLNQIRQTANQFLNDKIKNIIVLGTGGSIQTLLALKHLSKKNIFPITSSRAVELVGCLEKTTAEDSVVIPISRGGETLDINSTIGIFHQKGYNFLGLSSKGTMKDILDKIDCPILDVPDLSGRFAGSVTNVAIVPALLAGVNIEGFLKGLEEGYNLYLRSNVNPALEFSVFLYKLYYKDYKVIFSMPYSKNLEGSIGLLVQEISESTGKDEKGLMGAYQSAPLCQHSVLEYLLGGTKGAIIPILWTIRREIPDIILDSSIDYVKGQTAQTIVNYQADATFQALIEQNVPSAKLVLNESNERGIGNLISFIQSIVYNLCLLLDVNWANNPKVVIGKKICNDALVKKLPENERKLVRKDLAQKKFKDFYN